jgi:hypothetical protein
VSDLDQVTIQRVMEIIAARKALYAAKRDRADPCADEIMNRWECNRVLVEAMEWLEAEIRQEPLGNRSRVHRPASAMTRA